MQFISGNNAMTLTPVPPILFDFTTNQVQALRNQIKAAIASLAPIYSTYMHEHHGFDGTDIDIEIALAALYNLVCGLPIDAHLGKTKTEARANGRKCRKAWRQHGLRVGDSRKSTS